MFGITPFLTALVYCDSSRALKAEKGAAGFAGVLIAVRDSARQFALALSIEFIGW
jgi:hypothetical protein